MTNIKLLLNYVPNRCFSLTSCLEGKRNFRKFMLPNKRGTRIFKQQQHKNPDPEIPFYSRGLRHTGFTVNGRYSNIPEMIPQLIVPDLKDCALKPYVSYKVPDVSQPEFTAEELFEAIYAPKIIDDYKKNKLDAEGNPLEPSPEEKIKADEAYINARKTGSDIF